MLKFCCLQEGPLQEGQVLHQTEKEKKGGKQLSAPRATGGEPGEGDTYRVLAQEKRMCGLNGARNDGGKVRMGSRCFFKAGGGTVREHGELDEESL